MLPFFLLCQHIVGLVSIETLLEFLVDMLLARCDSSGRWTQIHRGEKRRARLSFLGIFLLPGLLDGGKGFRSLCVSFLPVKGVECPICEMREA